jgi:hypothetical protein
MNADGLRTMADLIQKEADSLNELATRMETIHLAEIKVDNFMMATAGIDRITRLVRSAQTAADLAEHGSVLDRIARGNAQKPKPDNR